ncbi:hypothetical protein SAMN05421640_1919 [Ekhidna lutea]|uniref:Uncharacterized protein n=1 Tax=Ekhidna lutea TaxID=447679 RepID=A0A239IZE7_EKHLU|nr:hypothetical protein [Ekhidna lutea]SNS99156.1 hypothetical protein SAMN05421640_1919 [Ekhidna lutea]
MHVRFEDHYFSAGLRYTFLIILSPPIVYVTFWHQFYILAGILSIVVFGLLTTKYVTTIDKKNNKIHDQFHVFFIRTGRTIGYRQLQYIQISKERHTYNANQRSRDRTADFALYTGTLMYDENESLEITTKSEFSWFGSEMNRLAEELQIPIQRNY